ncbi:MAG: hypothetical protein A2790_01070 [Phenylobacterium sp. RIFCSPHIGHO2_01_FULL_69_31]|jgi:hypothetical protein|uniref:DUF4180 domain-containing protein n=1 Tax=Phenylobacterium sp. RIFCSPHIGHO2_01_FULL_69_31 TaxID=1801944 RepID=UPI0008BB47DD|nr:DUF4180 domain-containing protein [Phenylobacterium sp. RIFCSPHIGHO2_01_FULL_69_31]OHB31538.1 MAG: hypothetical protein A2790_01070 [Phenylobacterium sp. RIFCSPHIGHO2_01_FULL_69_31]
MSLRSLHGVPTWACPLDGAKLDGERAATDIIGEAFGVDAKLVAIPVERLGDGFLDLRTRVAGEVIQKFVNYGFQVAFVGDVSAAIARSTALGDFVRESNRGRHVWFVADFAELESKLG